MMDILSPSFTNGHKYMGKSNVTTATTPAEGIAPPSPRLSMDEGTLAMLMEDKIQQENKRSSVALDKTIEEESSQAMHTNQADAIQFSSKPPSIDTGMKKETGSLYNNLNKNFPYQSPTAVAFAHDPSTYLVNKTKSLIYWEYPSQSAGLLCLILGGTWLTRYYSILYLLSGVFTVITSLNWVYVNVNFHSYRILSGKPVNTIHHPHSDRLMTQKRRTWFTEDQVDHACEVSMNLVEGVVKQTMDLVLIKDSMRSGYAVVTSFMVWTLASLLSIKTMVIILTVVSFVVPRLYLEHEEIVDEWLLLQQQNTHVWAQRHHAQFQVWLRQYHIVGQHLMTGLTVCYQYLSQFALFIYQKQQQWVKERQHAASLLRQKEDLVTGVVENDDENDGQNKNRADGASVAN